MFANKVVLITGASTGIGEGTAIHFAKEGATLVLTGRNKENLQKVADLCQLNSQTKLKPLTVVADLNDVNDIEKVISTTIETFSKLDVLVNNAGILAAGTIETTTLDQYDQIMNTNVRAPYYLTMLAVPHLLKTKGNIVNVSSIAGVRSYAGVLAYCISKAALDQFTRCVALEMGAKGVRVNSVNPGDVETGIHLKNFMTQNEYDDYLIKCKELHPLGRTGTIEEVASSIAFLASDVASNITGVTLPVDGGRHALSTR